MQSCYLEVVVYGVIVGVFYLFNGNLQFGFRFDYKLCWMVCLIWYVCSLVELLYLVLLLGDFNVIFIEVDVYDFKVWCCDVLFQFKVCEVFEWLLVQGWIDVLWKVYGNVMIYIFWDYFCQYVECDCGLCIDYLLLNFVLVE